MPAIIKVMLMLVSCFAVTFLIVKVTGILTIEQIQAWFELAKNGAKTEVLLLIIVLLFADLFIAVPTLSIVLFSGFFLGFHLAVFASITGMFLAGITGYWLSRKYGNKILPFMLKSQTEQRQAISSFQRHGFVFILLSRASPILPEVSACLAGIAKMPFYKFMLAWSLSTIPYALIASYAGSLSTLSNPKPAILTAIALSGGLWLTWYFYHLHAQHKKVRFKG